MGFCAVKQLAYHKGKKSIHRLVILPEFQGIGFGTKFLDEISKLYINKNWTVHITTSNKGLIYSLNKNNNWKFINQTLNRVQMETLEKKINKRIKYKGGSNIENCFTRQITSFKTNKKIWYGDEY